MYLLFKNKYSKERKTKMEKEPQIPEAFQHLQDMKPEPDASQAEHDAWNELHEDIMKPRREVLGEDATSPLEDVGKVATKAADVDLVAIENTLVNKSEIVDENGEVNIADSHTYPSGRRS